MGATRKRVEVKMGGMHPLTARVWSEAVLGVQAGLVGAADIEGGI